MVFFFECVGKVVHDAHVKVFTAKERVAVGGFNFEQAIVDFQDGHVECTAAKVIDRDGLCFFFVQTVCQRSRCRLVDDPQHFEASDFAGVFCRLTLSIVKVRRHGDNRLCYFFAEIAFSGFFHFAQDERGNLGRRVFLAARFDPCVTVATVDDLERHIFLFLCEELIVEPTTDKTLHSKDCVFWVGHGLTFCRLSNKAFVISESDDRRRCARAFSVLNNTWLRAVHDGDTRVCRSEVDTNNFGHISNPLH